MAGDGRYPGAVPSMEVTTWYLEIQGEHTLKPGREPEILADFTHVERPGAAFGRFLYTAVGGPWHWVDRRPWSLDAWQARLLQSGVETWVLFVRGDPAGYVELELHVDGSVEIAYFGLLPEHIGRGLGGHLLTLAIRRGLALSPRARVWVSTCSLDSPAALTNYQARGMTIYRTETRARLVK